ncbi:pilin [Pilimelia terevasa]|nr:pilin [Pilimelia terevasa]
MVSVPAAAYADTTGTAGLAAATLPQVIANLQQWLMGILAGVATLFLILAGVYWATAGGDPSAVERAKGALKNALIGYALAVLAPILLGVVKGIVGG